MNDPVNEHRPDPDKLLAEMQAERARQARGRLKVFFGMSAGVGKTYAMLEEARKRAAEGLDVLVGYAEPHIRPDTEAILLALEILPYQFVEYRGAKLKEFDLDAALARKPVICCVDEIAHTNAPGMRHQKRWQDIAELLDAGVSVYTTLNVQHLESVNDIVERVTGVRVRETLPDAVLEAADEVELVDIAPEELLERFREGKIYRPEQADRAAKHFFTKGNLIALRELALRKTAQRVDAQMREARLEAGVRSAWEASERVLVCVGPSPMSERLVRAAKRLADSLRAEWFAVSVETPASARHSDADRQRLDRSLRLAEQLGAQSVTLAGQRVAEEVVGYAQAHNVTKIVIGKPASSRLRDFLFGSVVDDLVRSSGRIDLHVIRGDDDAAEPPAVAPTSRQRRADWKGYGWALGLVSLATAIGWPLHRWADLSNTNVLMFYLLAVLWVATRHSRAAAVLASISGVAAFDLIFVPPYYTFSVADQQYALTLAVMLVTALVISALTLRARTQAEFSRSREKRTAALLGLSGDLSTTRNVEDVAVATVRHVAAVFDRRAVVLLPDADRKLRAGADSLAGLPLDAKEFGVAQWAFEHGQLAGRGTATLPAALGLYLPMRGSTRAVGLLALFPAVSADGWSTEQQQFAEAFASQAALALERVKLADEARQAWERVEAELVRNTLLSGVSHELRTPLAAITGAASALAEQENLTPETRVEMLDAIVDEAERMERLIENLLDMTRMEAGGLTLRREWVPLTEVVGAAVHATERQLKGRELTLDLPADLPLVWIDETAIEQVFVNLIDNAAEYTPAGTPIEVRAVARRAEMVVEIADRGPGLPAGTERRVFEKFFRARPSDVQSRRGIGLGLAICRGIIDAHGGKIEAANRDGGGAVFRFTLPLVGTPPDIDTTA